MKRTIVTFVVVITVTLASCASVLDVAPGPSVIVMGEEFTEELFSEDSSLAFEEDLVRQASYLTREDSIIVGIVNYMGVVVLHLYRRETYHWEFRRKRILNSSTDTISPWRLGKLPHGKYLLTVTIHNGEEPVKYGREFTVHLIP